MQIYGGTPAGWYPDPYYQGSLRYWDGTAWTAHSQAGGLPGGQDDLDIATGTKAARRAGIGFALQGLVQGVTLVAYPLVFSSFADTFREAMRNDGTVVEQPTMPPASLALNLLSPLSILAYVFILIWAFRATTNARALGRHTTHSPAWAVCAWIVPVVNFWFPYQVVRDLLPPDHPDRSKVGVWWACTLCTGVAWLPVGIIAVFGSTALAMAVAVVPFTLLVIAATLGRRLALAVGTEQAAAAAALGRG